MVEPAEGPAKAEHGRGFGHSFGTTPQSDTSCQHTSAGLPRHHRGGMCYYTYIQVRTPLGLGLPSP